MVLRTHHIACFLANWQDKPSNLRTIAKTLNIGLDSLVFADDNPFERNLVRQELPMVAVPELPDDPALYVDAIASAGYFEGLTLTEDDRHRGAQYQANKERDRLRETATDIHGYLHSLNMKMTWGPFDALGLGRIGQLINKSNQFNLTTRRYLHEELAALMNDETAVTLQLRLVDKFGDNGMIAVIIGKVIGRSTLEVDTWLMSCRVLGRQVEEATLNLLVEHAVALGMTQLVGSYLPTEKNGMVKGHYGRLGFQLQHEEPDGSSTWSLNLSGYQERATFITTTRDAVEPQADLLRAY